MRKIILASASPRRRDILKMAGYDFAVRVSEADENIEKADGPSMVIELSKRKAMAVAEEVIKEQIEEDFLIIGADTLVFADNEPMGKPRDELEEREFLKKLSGRSHEVITGVTICVNVGNEVRSHSFYAATKVYVADLNENEIDYYVGTGEWTDKAGGYAIQGYFAKFITGIEGEYENVVGFPLASFYQEIKRMELL